MAHRVLDERLHRHRRDHGAPGLVRDVHRDVKAVAEAGLLEPQVSLDMVELLAEGHVRAAVAEQVPGELREVGQQLARLVRPGVDVARDGSERVVDEMRGDLGAQRPQLRPCDALLLLGEHRQLDLRGDQARGLLHDP